VRRDDLPRYRALGWRRRLALDFRAGTRGIATRSFCRVVLLYVVLECLAQICIWQYDLRGPVRDVCYLAPALLMAPLVARGRRLALVRLLRKRNRGSS
jgi:hypothetical protein